MAFPASADVTTDPVLEEVEAIFLEHSRTVYRAAFRVTGRAEDAEDIVQALFVGLLTRGVPPGVRENPKAYLHRSAINAALNLVQSRRRRAAALELAAVDPAVGLFGNTSVAQQHRELHEQFVSAISQLSPRAVELLILRYEHGCTEAEIGRLVGMSRAAVAITLFRARARLKKLMHASSGEMKS